MLAGTLTERMDTLHTIKIHVMFYFACDKTPSWSNVQHSSLDNPERAKPNDTSMEVLRRKRRDALSRSRGPSDPQVLLQKNR